MLGESPERYPETKASEVVNKRLYSLLPVLEKQKQKLPAMIRTELEHYSHEKQQYFLADYNRKAKGTFATFICWIFGLHYAYLGKWGGQVIFWLTFGGIGCWWFIDVFRLSNLVEDRNKDIATQVLRDIKIIGA